MEGKTLILSVLIMLVMAQIQVEAKICCPSLRARNLYNVCRLQGSIGICSNLAGCKAFSGTTCSGAYPYGNLENSDVLFIQCDTVNEYCKLGCASSVCGALTTFQNSEASDIVNGAVAECTKACSTLCKGSLVAVETA